MKRLLILLCVAGLLAAIPLSHVAIAKKPEAKPAKVEICHVTGTIVVDDIGDPPGPGLVAYGQVISVSENAVDKHLAHGDFLDFNWNPDDYEKKPGDPMTECWVYLGPI